MKILFVNVSHNNRGRTYFEYPYGIGILATIAHNAGYSVHILDMAVDEREYLDVMNDFEPDIIALSFLSPSVMFAADVIRDIRRNFSQIIIAGGLHPTLYPKSVMNYGVDIVVSGEGEPVLLQVLEAAGKTEYLSQIPNIYYRDKFGEILYSGGEKESTDLDSLPIMNRDLFRLELYSHHMLLTSRCCPFNCRFCCSWAPGGKRGRIMSSARIMKELEYLTEHYGELTLYWGDEIFFWSRTERLNFCRELQRKSLPLKFTVQLRADTIDEELVYELKAAGCEKICIGAEAGSDILLKTANKKVVSSQIERAISVCTSLGMPCKTWWMIGLPGGGYDENMKALGIIERTMPNEVAVHQFVPLPGSEFWNMASKFGIRLPEEASFENLNYYSNPETVSYDYISGSELNRIIRSYEKRLLELGYVPTDEADENTPYTFTTPFQHTTFRI